MGQVESLLKKIVEDKITIYQFSLEVESLNKEDLSQLGEQIKNLLPEVNQKIQELKPKIDQLQKEQESIHREHVRVQNLLRNLQIDTRENTSLGKIKRGNFIFHPFEAMLSKEQYQTLEQYSKLTDSIGELIEQKDVYRNRKTYLERAVGLVEAIKVKDYLYLEDKTNYDVSCLELETDTNGFIKIYPDTVGLVISNIGRASTNALAPKIEISYDWRYVKPKVSSVTFKGELGVTLKEVLALAANKGKEAQLLDIGGPKDFNLETVLLEAIWVCDTGTRKDKKSEEASYDQVFVYYNTGNDESVGKEIKVNTSSIFGKK